MEQAQPDKKSLLPKVFIKTFGCQMNKLDSQLAAEALKAEGFLVTATVRDADIVVLNTCSVRDHAEQRVYSQIGNLQHVRKIRPSLVVAVIGCMAQRLGERLLDNGRVDVVCGPDQLPGLGQMLHETIRRKGPVVAVGGRRRDRPASEQFERFESCYLGYGGLPPVQAFVRVMRGCDNFCSYCIVPYVRGREVCRPPAAIVNQVCDLADRGVRQVTLLGQRVNAYSYSDGGRVYCLADLLEMVSGVDGIEWIRFVTSYPAEEYFDRILDAMAALPKVCPYLHLPAQSGSDRVLAAMNRRYTAARYLDLVAMAGEKVPGIAMAGDFIVGFPGETEEDFEKTVELCTKARYRNCFVFRYSPRPGTRADGRLADNVPPEVKKSRNVRLLAVQEKISAELARGFDGTIVRVLVEGPSKKARCRSTAGGGTQLAGRTSGDWIVVFDGSPKLAGQFADVKITGATPLTLFGELA